MQLSGDVVEDKVSGFAVIGKRIPSIDAREMARGRILYVSDLNLPGMLEAGALRSPYAHAKIVSVDASRAESLSGVKAVITGANSPKVKYGAMIDDETMLAVNKVRHFGEEVAAVAAVDEDVVEEALSLIRVQYEELPAVFNAEEALASSAPLIHDKSDNIAQHFTINRGDVEEGFRRSDIVIENSYTTQITHPSYVEPIASLASYESGGLLTVWLSTQDPFRARQRFSRVLSLPESKIRIHQTYVGGGFGGKIDGSDKCGLIASLLSMKSGRPVRLAFSRNEELSGGSRTRHPMKIRLKIGVKRNGTLLAKEAKIIANTGAYASLGPSALATAATRADCLYRFQYVRNDAYLVYTNMIPAGAFRGLGNVQSHFAAECMIDEIAKRLEMDPVELRLMNATRKGDLTVHGWEIRSCGLSECIQKAAQVASWTLKRSAFATDTGAKRRGIGIACGLHVSSVRTGYDASTAWVTVNHDGTVSVATGQADIGSGENTVFAMIAAEVLGLSVDEVAVLRVDTLVSPFTRGTSSSRSTVVTGNAVRLAAENARKQLLEAASEVLAVPEAALTIRDGRITVKGRSEKSISLSDIAKFVADHKGPIFGIATYDPPTVPRTIENQLYGNASPNYPFAAHIAEVEVDLETGQVKLLGYVAAHDIGRAINRMGVEGQIEGGVGQGVGYALTEEIIYEDNRVVNPSFLDYKLPCAEDVPTIKTILVETDDPEGPFGAKSIGEVAIVPVAPAIANAIRNATGKNLTRLPMTPEEVHMAMLRS